MPIMRPTPPTRPTPPSVSTGAAKRPAPPKPGGFAVPIPDSSALPKEAKDEAPKQEPKAEAQTATSRTTAKPSVPAGQPADSRGPSEDHGGKADEAEEAAGQLTIIQLHAMPLPERHALWKRLNRALEDIRFIPLLRPEELPKKMVKEYPPANKPSGKGVMWCAYCADWTIFEHYPYVGSHRCIGCSISNKDFYNRGANNLWKVDL